jgi:hypothetical protein
MPKFYIVGASYDPDTYFCHHLSKRIAKQVEDIHIEFQVMLELDYIKLLNELRKSLGGGLYTHKVAHLVMKDNEYVGNALALIKMAVKDYGIGDAEIANNFIFDRLCRDETRRLIVENGRPCVFLEFKEESLDANKRMVEFGKVIIEL